MENVATLICEGKLEEAEIALNSARSEVMNSADWHYHRGLLLEARGMADKACEAYEKAVELDSEHQESTFRLAYNLDLYGEEDQAIELYETLANRTPALVSVLLNLATIYEDHGQYEDAAFCVERVLSEHPNHARARLFLKDIRSSMTMHYDEAHEHSRMKRDAILDTHVSDFELSVRSRNCLKKMNIHTLGDLLRITESELLSYKNFGDTSLHEIKAMLKQKGLHLGQLKEEEEEANPFVHRTLPAQRPTVAGSPDYISRSLSEVEFSSRARKCLMRLGLVTMGDLAAKTEAELLASKNFGQTSLIEVKEKLEDFGLALRKPE